MTFHDNYDDYPRWHWTSRLVAVHQTEAKARKSRQSAQQDTDTDAARRQARQNVDWVRQRINGQVAETLRRVSAYYAEGGRELAEQWRRIIEDYGGEHTWTQALAAGRVPLSAQQQAARLQALMQQVDVAMQRMVQAAGDETLRATMEAYRQSYYGTSWTLDQQLPLQLGVTAPVLPHQAVMAAVLHPYQGMTYLERYAEQRPALLLSLRRTIALSQLEGESVSQATSRLLRLLGVTVGEGPVAARRQAAADALNVKPVRRGMTPRKHAELLVRTELIRASATGAEAVMAANADVVAEKEWQATNDRITESRCRALDGKSWAIDDPAAPTIPLHARCVLPGQWVAVPSLVAATKSLYEGVVIEVCTAHGRRLRVTPNHPVATPNGWVAAGLLCEGDHVVSYGLGERIGATVYPHDDERPSLIEEVFGALMHADGVLAASMKAAAEDFHGDGRFMDANIHVVRADGELGRDWRAALAKPLRQHLLSGCDMGEPLLPANGLRTEIIPGLWHATLDRIGGGGQPLPILGSSLGHADVHALAASADGNASITQSPGDRAAIDPVQFAQALDRHALVVQPHQAVFEGQPAAQSAHGTARRLNSITDGLARLDQPPSHGFSSGSVLLRQFRQRCASAITLDPIVAIRRIACHGHVYDLQDGMYSLYICNGIVVHNCRCAWLPVSKSFAELGLTGLEQFEPKPRKTYKQWAAEHGIPDDEDGGLRQQRGKRLERTGKTTTKTGEKDGKTQEDGTTAQPAA